MEAIERVRRKVRRQRPMETIGDKELKATNLGARKSERRRFIPKGGRDEEIPSIEADLI